jgi:hypothetical protein
MRLTIILACLLLFIGCNKTKKMKLGDTYQGGKIAYLDASGEHGMIVSPSDLISQCEWGCNGIEIIGADSTKYGYGKENTNDILLGCNQVSSAAKICDNYSVGGYSDWFLPSIDELQIIYDNRVVLNIDVIGISPFYWSSTEYNANNAKGFSFSGTAAYSAKNNLYSVLAVRYF